MRSRAATSPRVRGAAVPLTASPGSAGAAVAVLPRAASPPILPSKYRAKPTFVDGIRFASKAESERYKELKLLENGGLIKELRLQPRYALTTYGQKLGEYRGDFEFMEYWKNGIEYGWHRVCEDVKGYPTELFEWKWRHVQLEYRAVEFRLVKKGKR